MFRCRAVKVSNASSVFCFVNSSNMLLISGVNQAMQDANELAHAIINVSKGTITLDEAIQQYEQKMFERAAEIGKESTEKFNLFFEKDSPKGLVDTFNAIFAQAGLHHS